VFRKNSQVTFYESGADTDHVKVVISQG